MSLYTLMHKDIPVLDAEIEKIQVQTIRRIHSYQHIPIGIQHAKNPESGTPDTYLFQTWWHTRGIPASRINLEHILKTLNIQNTAELLSKSLSLSLSDHYWIKPKNSDLNWNDVNFFHNVFSGDLGEILIGHKPGHPLNINFHSPDNTSDGWLAKKWIIQDGKRFLMKSGSGIRQEPYNERFASSIMRRLTITHVPYTVVFYEDQPFSLCENFVTPETELVSAYHLLHTFPLLSNESSLQHLLRRCDELHIPGVPEFLDQMLTLDFIIANADRHLNNFGFLRNPETLEWVGPAPIFDSGASLWHNMPIIGYSDECKPFAKTHTEQIQLVQNLEWFHADALSDISSDFDEIFKYADHIPVERLSQIKQAVSTRILHINQLRQSKHH